MNASHTVSSAGMKGKGQKITCIRLCLIDINRGMGIFECLDGAPARITCPMTPDYVLPYAERSVAKENLNARP